MQVSRCLFIVTTFNSHADKRQRIPDSRRRIRPGRRDRAASGRRRRQGHARRSQSRRGRKIRGESRRRREIRGGRCDQRKRRCSRRSMPPSPLSARLHGLVNCAGVAPGERVVGKNGPHKLETFSRVININLIGTFNALRLAANAMAQEHAERRRRARRDHQHRVGRRVRRPDRAGRVQRLQGRHRRDGAADRARARQARHPRE